MVLFSELSEAVLELDTKAGSDSDRIWILEPSTRLLIDSVGVYVNFSAPPVIPSVLLSLELELELDGDLV